MSDVEFSISVGVDRQPIWAIVQQKQINGLNARIFVPINHTEFTLEQLHELHTQAVTQQQSDSLLAWITIAIDNAQRAAALSTTLIS